MRRQQGATRTLGNAQITCLVHILIDGQRNHHVDVLETVPRPDGQAAVEAQSREGAEDVLIQRLVVAVDVVGHLCTTGSLKTWLPGRRWAHAGHMQARHTRYGLSDFKIRSQ